MKVRNILSVLLCMVLMMVSCDSSIAPVDSTLEVRGAEAKIIFTVGGVTGLVFNTSDIVIEDGWIVRGNLASTYTEHGIKGFAGSEEMRGYFLPLEIVTGGIDDGDDVKAVFMGSEVPADILRSGGKYYAVIRLTDDITLEYDNSTLSVEITAGNHRCSAEMSIKQKHTIAEDGFLLNPVIVSN